jgi:hypothetical protein
MDPITQQVVLATAGAAAADPATYVDDVFSTYVYEGTGSAQTITNGIDLSGEGGLVWIKNRDAGFDHHLVNTIRGATNYLESNQTAAENTYTIGLSAFGSNSFTLGGSGSLVNASSNNYVSWTFRKAPGFFDIVIYNGDTDNNQTIAHSLGSKPGMILIKNLTNSYNWAVFHEEIPVHDHLKLNTFGSAHGSNYFVNEPTSTHFTVIGGEQSVNITNNQYVAYLFANDDARFGTNSDEPIIKCGTYYGNGTTQEIDLGFEPQWLMIKNVSSISDQYGNADWFMVDIIRGMTTEHSRFLVANEADAEAFGGRVVPTATGFNIVTESNIGINAQSDAYIYMAIRRPHKPPTAGTDVFAAAYQTGATTTPGYISGFPVDAVIRRDDLSGNTFGAYLLSRLTGTQQIATSSAVAETTNSSMVMDYMNGYNSDTVSSTDVFSLMFKRAPGFMDVVAYKGTGIVRTVSHNLNAVPELMLVKSRDLAYNWFVYSSVTGNNKRLHLNTNDVSTNSGAWNNTTPTASVFTLSSDIGVNRSNYNYIAYLFATLPGISKVGSYSGSTGSSIDVDCGFTAGARFVLIKRLDDNAHLSWILWDATRGIVSGNDPYILLYDTAAQVTTTDYIDPLNAGFTITSSAPVALNTTGSTYLFLAIA